MSGNGQHASMDDPHSSAMAMQFKSTIDIATTMNEGAWRPAQIRVLVLVCCVMCFDGLDTQAFAFALPAIKHDFGAALGALGRILALSFVTMAIGTLVGGLSSDRFGRRRTLIASIAVFGIATAAGALSSGLLTLGATRLCAAFGIGAAFPTATALVSEYTPKRMRPFALSVALGSVPAGAFAGGIMASYVLPTLGWHALFGIFGVLSAGCGVALATMLPESVRSMIARSRPNAAVAAMLKRTGYDVPDGVEIVDTDVEVGAVPVRVLLSGQHRVDLIFVSMAFLMIGFCNMAIAAWLPSLITSALHNIALGSRSVALYSLGGLAGCLIGFVVLSRSGSRMAFLVFSVAAMVGAGLVAIVPFGQGFEPPMMLLSFFALGVLIPGIQVMLYAFAGQIFPIEARASGVGFASALGRVGAFGAALIGPLLLSYGQSGFFLAMATGVLIAGIALLLTPRQLGRRGTMVEVPVRTVPVLDT